MQAEALVVPQPAYGILSCKGAKVLDTFKRTDDDDDDDDDIIIRVQGGLNLLACSIFKGNHRYQFTIFYISLTCIYLYQPVYTKVGSLPST